MFTVLLVEDHPLNRKLFRQILESKFHVAEADSAEIALEKLATVTPDLILLDIELPGMDGLSLARLLKSDPHMAAVPIIALSARRMRDDIEEAHAAGCLDYIIKPIGDDPDVFLERVSRRLIAR